MSGFRKQHFFLNHAGGSLNFIYSQGLNQQLPRQRYLTRANTKEVAHPGLQIQIEKKEENVKSA